MCLIDTHNHLDFPDFNANRATLLQRSRVLRVERQVVLGVYRGNWQRVWDLTQAEDGLYTALGLHPAYLARYHPQHLGDLRQWLQRLRDGTRLCVVGEVGLDYHLEHLGRDAQQVLFETQLWLAAGFRLPVLIHICHAHAAIIATLECIRLERRDIIHTFAGNREEAREYLRPGFRFGPGGAPTWSQINRLRKAAVELPADVVVLETDAPDMALSMHPDQCNNPEYLPNICRTLAELCGVDAEELAASSSRNAAELFGWDRSSVTQDFRRRSRVRLVQRLRAGRQLRRFLQQVSGEVAPAL